MKSGIEKIAEERQRQIEKEGYTAEHDMGHTGEEFIRAAISYLLVALDTSVLEAWRWPWERQYFKPSKDIFRNLEKAGALIAAGYDRLNGERGEVEAEPKYPKLTVEALKERGFEWPEWATCAVVNGVKHAYFHEIYPHSGDNTWCTFDDCHVRAIPGEWDASDWENSLIERPSVEKDSLTTELPEWVTVGGWCVFVPTERFYKIESIDSVRRRIRTTDPTKENSGCEPTFESFLRDYKSVKLIPWDDSSLPPLPFCVKFKNDGKNFRTTVVSASISGVWLGGATNVISYAELSNDCEMLDGSPCGVLEVVENEQ